MELSKEQETRLWQLYLKNKEVGVREKLISSYLPYTKMLAAVMFSKRIDVEVEYSDYEQNATIGLLEAIDRYNPNQGASFKTFASYRIKGAILNGISKYSEKQQQITYLKNRKIERLNSLTNEKYPSLFEQISEVTIGLAIGYLLSEDISSISIESTTNRTDLYASLEIHEARNILIQIVNQLPEQEKEVVKLSYFEDKTFKEITELMNLSKGRISQIHKSAIMNLRGLYEKNSEGEIF